MAQLRFDQAFVVSSLQSEKPSVSTMLRANKAVEDFKKDKGFELRFRNVNFQNGGIVSVSDAALGNVDELGRVTPLPEEKVHSQSCYAVLLADENLAQGKAGNFNLLDFRSHRIPRVCRSSYSAETLGAEEGLDSAELVRGFIAAELRGVDVSKKDAFLRITAVPLVGVTDAKDTYDRVTHDTGFGTQKSLAFTIAALRQQLRRPNTFRWTSASNMWVDAGTKLMDTTHIRRVLQQGRWSIEFAPEYVKQTSKKAKAGEAAEDLPGRAVGENDRGLLEFVFRHSEEPGWHFVDGIGINVSRRAKSMRSPQPRCQGFPSADIDGRVLEARWTM